MSNQSKGLPSAAGELKTLQQRLIGMADLVESALAECIVALVDNEPGAAEEVRLEDYKAHRAWLEVDGLCLDLLCSGELDRDQVRFVHAAVKIAMNLKQMADECLRISRQVPAGAAGKLAQGAAAEIIPGIAQIAQSMLSDSIEALVNKDPVEAQGLPRAYPELESLGRQLLQHAVGKTNRAEERLEPTAPLLLAGRSLETIGRRALEIASDVAHLYPDDSQQDRSDAEQ